VMYGNNITFSTSYPSKILISDFPTTNSSDGASVLLSFVDTLASYLNATVERFNVLQAWAENMPSNATTPIEQFLNLKYPILISKEQVKNIRAPFYREYAAKHDGRLSFVDPVPLRR